MRNERKIWEKKRKKERRKMEVKEEEGRGDK